MLEIEKTQTEYSSPKKFCRLCLYGEHHENANKYCPNFLKCKYAKNVANTIINKYPDFTEVVFYKENFYIPKNIEKENIDRSRKWIRDADGYLCPKDPNQKIEDLQLTISNSRKRTLDNIYGFILSNDWDYFVTVTFQHGKFKKLSDEQVKYQWQKFRQQLQYRFNDIKIFLVPEDTPTGVNGMHFHGFMGNANLSEYLRPARNNKKMYNDKPNEKYGELLYTEYGDQIFNFKSSFLNIGFTTIVKLRDKNRLKLVNYMTKYMNKDSSNFDYNENAYLRTYNLDFKEKLVAKFTSEEKTNLVSDLMAVKHKETKKMIVYRIFN